MTRETAHALPRPRAAFPAIAVGSVVLCVSIAARQAPVSAGSEPHLPASANAPGLPSAAAEPGRPAAAASGKAPEIGPVPEAKPNEHPLLSALRWAQQDLPAIERLADYSAILAKRERVDGRLGDYEYLSVKIRHTPFSVYVGFLAPAAVRGQEVLYVEGQNNGAMWAHKAHLPSTLSVRPDSPIAMRGRRYPLTEIGLVNLVRRLVEVGQQDINYGECEVKYLPGVKINGRACTMIQIVHPQPRRYFRFHLARIYVDDELRLPTRYESYDWPSKPDGQPELMEEYTYLNLKLNNGFTDNDFSIRSPAYHFP